MRNRRYIVALGILVMALAGAGCGGDEESTTATSTSIAPAKQRSQEQTSREAEQAVSEAQISRSSRGSPERTVLEWWRDVQVNDPEHAVRLYADPPTLPNLAGQFNFVAGRLAGSVEIVSVESEGNRAVVRVRWSRPRGEVRRVRLRLERDGGAWKLSDARFLDEMVAELQETGSR